jgi:hypothetical protein
MKQNILFFQPSDDENRLEEALVRFFVSQVCKDLPEHEVHQLLNPNEVRCVRIYYKQVTVAVDTICSCGLGHSFIHNFISCKNFACTKNINMFF